MSVTAASQKLKVRERFYEDGTRRSLKHFLAGKLEGALKKWYPNGNIKCTATYSNGVLEGPCRKYYPDGLLKSVANYSVGVLHFVSEEFHPNGQRKSQVEYKEGRTTDNWYMWDEKGMCTAHMGSWGMYTPEGDVEIDKIHNELISRELRDERVIRKKVIRRLSKLAKDPRFAEAMDQVVYDNLICSLF
jgi:antitoxin component YwqK of YwqJK toxin-antitoxin module